MKPELHKPETWEENQVFFSPADRGDAQLADGYHAAGTIEGWLEAIRPIAAYPRVQLLLYASFAASLIMPLGAPNFVVDTAYATTSGKTTALRVAASVWGRPDAAGAGTMWTWEATPVWIERTATVINSMPLILDDTKLARRPADVARTLYMFASGAGRGRGSKTGIDVTRHFRSVMISSGEAPITSFTQDGGTRARTLSMWGSPFEGPGSARTVAELNQELPRHYGHAAEPYIHHLMSRGAPKDENGELQKLYRESHEKYLSWAAGDAVAGRLAAYCAVIDTAAVLAHEALDMPFAYADPLELLWDSLVSRASEADRAEVALQIVWSWASANQQAFWGRHRIIGGSIAEGSEGDPVQPPGGWAGSWASGEDWEYIALFPARIRAILLDHDFSAADAEAAVTLWRERGWLDTDSDADGKSRNVRHRVERSYKRLVTVRREALERDE